MTYVRAAHHVHYAAQELGWLQAPQLLPQLLPSCSPSYWSSCSICHQLARKPLSHIDEPQHRLVSFGKLRKSGCIPPWFIWMQLECEPTIHSGHIPCT